ncbi:zinc-ribbon domain-containing protein [Candidatus Pelagibacter sp.]|uniref:zinc-ribbon domain-containing protein n=1 Tax=Candidatus Pelagibacter sp. TaxID=2024849 RepID=UPI003F83AE34
MIIDCICGKKKFRLADDAMPAEGSKVRCGSCSEVWYYHPDQGNSPATDETLDYQNQETQIEQSNNDNFPNETDYEDPVSNTKEEPPIEDDEELLSTIDEDEIAKEADKDINEKTSGFKIFTDEDDDLPSKEEMDKNLDNLKIERDKNLNFFQKLFKKDHMRDAAKAIEKKKEVAYSEENQKVDVARRTRLLFYLLILLTLVFSVFIVPMREDIGMAFPFMKSYLDFLVPVYEYIRVPLGFN